MLLRAQQQFIIYAHTIVCVETRNDLIDQKWLLEEPLEQALLSDLNICVCNVRNIINNEIN